MKCQILFSEKKKYKKNIITLSPAELAYRVVKFKKIEHVKDIRFHFAGDRIGLGFNCFHKVVYSLYFCIFRKTEPRYANMLMRLLLNYY